MSAYPAPTGRGNPIYNPIDYHTIGTAGDQQTNGISQTDADKRYLFLGNTQGRETFNYPTTFTTPATFSGNGTATFVGTNTSQAGTAPLNVTNSDTNLYSAFYQDHNNQDQLTIQSNTTLGGLTLRNAAGNSFTVYPAGVNNAATFINPINVINNLGVSCGSLTLSNAGNSTALTTTATGLNVADPIVATGSVTCDSLTLSNSGNTTALTTTSTGLNVADPIVSTGSVTCNNLNLINSGYSTALTTTSSGLNINDPTVVAGSVTCNSLNLSDSGYSTALTTTSTGLNINDPVTCNSLTTSGTGNITTSGVLQLNTGAYSVQLGCSNLGNQLVVNQDTQINGDLNTTTSVVTQGVLQGNTLTTVSDATIGGTTTITGTTIANSSLRLASNANIAGATISTAGLTIGRNLEVGQNEFDIIAINPTTANYLNIYGSQSSISAAAVPIISIANNTAYLNGVQIATVSGAYGAYTVGQIITGIFSTPPTGFLACNGQYIPTSSYPSLFALIGTAYNAYNSVPTGYYSMPNLVSAVPLGANSVINEYGTNIPSYNDTAILNNAQGGNNLITSFLSHSHSVTTSHSHTYGTGYVNVSNGSGGGTCATQTGGSGGPTYYTTSVAQPTTATGSAGASNVSNLSQFLAVYYYIYGGNP